MPMAVEEVMAAKQSRVLLGETDAASLAHREHLLPKSGYDIVSARDGTEALKGSATFCVYPPPNC